MERDAGKDRLAAIDRLIAMTEEQYACDPFWRASALAQLSRLRGELRIRIRSRLSGDSTPKEKNP